MTRHQRETLVGFDEALNAIVDKPQPEALAAIWS
jgi:hypothetical protein